MPRFPLPLRLASLFALLASAALLSSPSAAAPPSHPLTCVGGGSMRMDLGSDHDGLWREIRFEPGTQAASALKPGQCAWLVSRHGSGRAPSAPRFVPRASAGAALPDGAAGVERDLPGRGNARGGRSVQRALVGPGSETVQVHPCSSRGERVVTRFGP
jgi:hypothetical protein